MKRKLLTLALCAALALCALPMAAFAEGKDLNDSGAWITDRTEPENFAVENGKISFGVAEQPGADSWYGWQGRKAYTEAGPSSYWKVSYTMDVTETMTSTDKVNASVWVQVDKEGGNGAASQQDTVDWAIVQFINDGGAKWQAWNSTGSGSWADLAGVSAAPGSYTIEVEFFNGTLTQYVNGAKVYSYTLSETKTAPAALIAQGRSYGAAFEVSLGVPAVATTTSALTANSAEELQAAVNAVADGGTVTLGADISLAAPVQVPAGKTVIVNGGGHGIALTAAGAAFNESASVEGLKAGTSLTVNNVSFTGHTAGQADHAVVVGSQGGVNVALNGCSFTNMYDAVYCNQVTDAAAPVSTVTISGCTFSNVAHSYGVDDGATAGARVDKHAFALSGNTGEPAPETFAVAEVDGVGYTSLEAAVAAAASSASKTVTLRCDVALDKMLTIDADGLVLDLNGKTITASDAFQSSYPNDSHLINIGSETATVTGVTVKNGTVRTTAANKHAVNVYKSAQVTLKDLTLDHTTASTGAPLVVNSSSVKVEGKLDLKLGSKSWYGINVDGKYGAAGLDFAAGSAVTMTGREGLPVITTGNNGSVTGAEAAGLQDNGDGTFGLKPAPTPVPTPVPTEKPSGNGGGAPAATAAPAPVLDSTPKTGAVSLSLLPLAGFGFAALGTVSRKRR